jgi:hypothetical protein
MTKRNITTEIFKMAFIVVAIPTLANILSRDIKLEKGFLLANLKLYTLAFVAMFVSVSGLMLLFSFILRRRTRSITLLQESVAEAIEHALNQSSFNPHRSNKQHEQQLTRKTSIKP